MLEKIKAVIITSCKSNKPIFALSSLYFLLFNSVIIAFKFSHYKVHFWSSILELSKDSIYILLTLCIIFYSISLYRILLYIGSAFLFFTGAIGSYIFYFFHIAPSKNLIRTLFENEISETSAGVSWYLLLWVSFSVLSAIWLISSMYPYTCAALNIRKYLTRLACLVFVLLNIANPQYKVLAQYFPINYLHSYSLYMMNKYHHQDKLDITSKYSFIDKSPEDIVGVLVIGESARYDHFGINGYTRNTTPNLSKIDNLFSFKAEASANLTYLSVPSMLTMATRKNIDESLYQTTFLSVLTKFGFQTSWVGTQSLMKYLKGYGSETMYDEVRISIIPGGSVLYALNAYDEVLLPYVDSILASKGKSFIVIHTSGSHWNYAARHPEEYNIFKPSLKLKTGRIDQPNCKLEELVNSYDNSILYTDYILSEIIKKLKGHNAFMLYASDHGESLGENGIYAHGSHMNTEQLTIPFIFWGSSKFMANHPTLSKRLESLQNKILSHDYIFHSVLDCVGVESGVIDRSLSVCDVGR